MSCLTNAGRVLLIAAGWARFGQETANLALRRTDPSLYQWRMQTRRVSQSCKAGERIVNTQVKVDTSLLALDERNKEIESNLDKYFPSMTVLEKGLPDNARHFTINQFKERYGEDESLNAKISDSPAIIYGRIQNIRSSGKKIWFLDINDHFHTDQPRSQLQIIINFKRLASNSVTLLEFESHMNQLRKNDYIQCLGHPGLSQSRQRNLSLLVNQLPIIVSPSQSPLPSGLSEDQKINNNRTINYQVNGTNALFQRATIIRLVRQFYQDHNQFVEVETPILSSKANGASARPFQVSSQTQGILQMRIAPELWLKRLIIGGMPRIFEIGKIFRNEGIDSTHNPEFTMLESYQTYATMETLIDMMERLFKYLLLNIPWQNETAKELAQTLESQQWKFKRIEFIPMLSKELGIPNLAEINLDDPKELLDHLPLDAINTLCLIPEMSSSQILDKLSSRYLESKHGNSLHPTIIYHHPLIMSPLAKSVSQNTTFKYTKRFEMFIRGKEYVNAYEEENCPQIQLSNFRHQQEGNSESKIDYQYIEAMKSGMPPTGGIGIGIDRLCMLLMEKTRIEQVLSFGSLDDVNRQ